MLRNHKLYIMLGNDKIKNGKVYIINKPGDLRNMLWVHINIFVNLELRNMCFRKIITATQNINNFNTHDRKLSREHCDMLLSNGE